MAIIAIVVFIGVFVVVALLFAATGTGSTKQDREMLARLDSALATGKSKGDMSDLLIDVRKNELLSTIPWVDKLLRQVELTPRLRRLLYQADLKWTVGGLLMMCFVAFIIPGYLVYLRTGNLIFGLAIGLAFGFAPIGYVVFKRNKRMSKFEEGLPEALDLICSALRVGHSLNSALGLVTRECPDPVGTEFRVCFDEQNYGLELKTALENLTNRVPVQDLRIVVTGILIQKESGGNLAEVLEKASEVIRERFRLKRQVMTHTAQGRLTGLILTMLPIVLGCALYFINPEMMSLLWTRDIGVKLLYAAGGMIVVGGLIIRKIVNMDV
ncbi:MAG TPA: type II secretion system F family protein [Terracidiphilus sp.]|nr:type II secretion system F family protein [Terracidiphilus sp.]HEX4283989.1 type II secretion system F family protein [Terracidiphilus sp.]